MNIQIKAKNIELTDSLRNYIEEKMQGVEKVINAHETEPLADIEVGRKTNHHQSGDELYFAEINLTIGGAFFRTRAEMSELYAAVDVMKDNITREVRRDKEKRQGLIRRGALRVKNMIRGTGRRRK